MTDAPDMDALAETFLDLWEAQLAVASRDAETYRALSLLLGLGTRGFDRPPYAAQDETDGSADRTGGRDADGGDHVGGGAGERGAGSAPRRTEASRAPHGDRGDRLDELFARLDRIEKRLAALESGAAERG